MYGQQRCYHGRDLRGRPAGAVTLPHGHAHRRGGPCTAGPSPKDGLSSSAAVQERLAARGHNGIAAGRVTREELAIRQSRSAFTYLLLIAAAIVFVIPGGAFPQV